MKGQLSINPTFHPLNIHRPHVQSRNPLVVFDNHRLHYNSTSIPWNNKAIINCTSVPSLNAILVLCSDWKLYVYNSNLDLVGKLSDWQSKYSVGFEYIQSRNLFILVGVIEIELLKVNIRTNVKQTKFLSSVRFNIDRVEFRAVQESNRLTWNKGFNYDLQEELLYVWSSQNINFYGLNKLDLKSSIQSLVKKQTAITYVHLNRSFKYTLTGLTNGNLKVWRLPLILVSVSQYLMIHNCIYHTKAVDRIIPAVDDRIVISSSQDLTLCMWSLQTFDLLRVYNFEGEYSAFYLVDHKHAYVVKNGQLGDLVFGKTMEFIHQIDSSIVHIDKSKHKNSSNFQFTLASNVGFQVRAKDLSAADLNKIDIAYFYPPLKAQSIIQVLSSPYDPSIYYMLVQTGKLFSVILDGNSSRIQQSYSLQHAQDCQGHPCNQYPTLISFIQIGDIQFDSQIIQNVTSSNHQGQLNLITVGCSRGSIIVFSLDRLDKIRSRFTYHRESIKAIELITQKNSSNKILASMCNEDYIRFTSLQKDKAHCYLSIFCDNSLLLIKGFQHQLALAFRKGILQLCEANQYALTIQHNPDAVDHQGQILSIDYQPIKQLILTSGTDNRLKIWSMLKQLLFQIKLDQGLSYAIWSNSMQIFVAHRNKLLYIRNVNYQFNEYEFAPTITPMDIRKIFGHVKSQLKPQMHEYRISRNRISSDVKQVQKGNSSLALRMSAGKNKSVKRKPKRTGNNSVMGQQQKRKKLQVQSQIKATQKHIQQLQKLRKAVNQRILPSIGKKEDKFEEFVNNKIVNKKMLTRRDITLNRIIMKNLIREQFRQEEEFSQLKLDL